MIHETPNSIDSQPGSCLDSFDKSGIAVVFGAGGGIGSALLQAVQGTNHFRRVIGYSRCGTPTFDLLDEASIERAANVVSAEGEIRLVVDATGFLHGENQFPEKSLRELDAMHLGRAFAINAIGPALLMKHVLPRLPRTGKAAFATLSARVGSIADNRIGGWYGYRSSKAALNQFVRTAAIEVKRRAPQSLCVALQPGTVATPLSAPFAKPGPDLQTPEMAAHRLIAVINKLTAEASGGFFDWRGDPVPW